MTLPHLLPQESVELQAVAGLHPLGAGHSSTAPLLAFFAHMGTLYIRLSQFSLLVEEHGCVARGLTASLREFLQLYQGSVVRAAGGLEHTEVTLNIVTLSIPPSSPSLPAPPASGHCNTLLAIKQLLKDVLEALKLVH